MATMAVATVGFTACEDEPDKYEVAGGVPTVYYVRSLSTEIEGNNDDADTHYTNGELVEEASPQTSLALIGDNLRSVYELYFNDQKATLNTSYITDNALIVSVPRTVPTVVTDLIYMITKDQDTVTYDFHVVIPAPQISSMSNEHAPAGDEVTLTGGYFIDDPGTPLTVSFLDEDGSPIYASHDDMTFSSDYATLSLVVPEGAAEGAVTVTSIYGATSSTFYYMDTRGMLFDFEEGGLTNHGWHDRVITRDETSLEGNFVQLGNGTAVMSEDGGWDDANFSFEYWCGSWDDPQNVTSGDGIALFYVADFSDYQNKALKFEMYIPESYPWMAGAMQIAFEPYNLVTLSGYSIEGWSGTVAAANAYIFNGEGSGDEGSWGRAMYRPWTSTGSYDTGGKWETVTVPLTSFNYDRTGSITTTVPSAETDFASLTIFIMGGGINGTECTPIVQIDNIRVVPN